MTIKHCVYDFNDFYLLPYLQRLTDYFNLIPHPLLDLLPSIHLLPRFIGGRTTVFLAGLGGSPNCQTAIRRSKKYVWPFRPQAGE